MSHRKLRETKHKPGTAGPGNILGCCLVSLPFLCDINSIHPVDIMFGLPVGVVPMRSGEVDHVVDADLGGVGLGEVDEGDVAEELLGCNLGVLLALDQSPYLLLEVWQANW